MPNAQCESPSLTSHRLALVGLTTALFGPSPLSTTNAKSTKTTSSSTYDSINTIVIAGNVFLAHRQSLGAFFDSIGSDVVKPANTEAMASTSFDDDVEMLLDHGW